MEEPLSVPGEIQSIFWSNGMIVNQIKNGLTIKQYHAILTEVFTKDI